MDTNRMKFLDGLEYLEEFKENGVSFTKKNKKGCLLNPTGNIVTFPFSLDFSDLVPYLLSLEINLKDSFAGNASFASSLPLVFFWGTSIEDFDDISISCGNYKTVGKTRNGHNICSEPFNKAYAVEPYEYDDKTHPFYNLNVFVNFEKIFIMKNYSPIFHGKIDFNFIETLGFRFPFHTEYELSNIRIYENMPVSFWRKFHIEEKFIEKSISDDGYGKISNASGEEEPIEDYEEDSIEESDDYQFDNYDLHDNGDGTWTTIGGRQLDYYEAMILREQSDLEDGIVPDDQMGGD